MQYKTKEIIVDPSDIKLFRFRPINKFTLKELKKDSFVASSPTTFNDPYDCLCFYDNKKIKKHILKEVIKNHDKVCSYFSFINFASDNEIADYIYQKYVSPNASLLNRDVALACLTTNINHEIMWAHYADNSKGFAIQYKIEDIIDAGNKHSIKTIQKYRVEISENDLPSNFNNLAIVQYQKNKFDITPIYLNFINNIFKSVMSTEKINLNYLFAMSLISSYPILDFFDVLKSAYCLKKEEWSYENEWRFVFLNLSLSKTQKKHVAIGKVKPIKIFLGEKIDKKNKKKILKICKKKKITVRQMYSSIKNKTFELKSKRIPY